MKKVKRKLTELEKQFCEEAEKGHFLWDIDADNGRPFALGAPRTDNLFSMDVIEEPDSHSGGSIYWLREPDVES